MLKPGDPAPDFSVPDETGKVRTLSEFKGKTLVLWFYPRADTPGCTIEGCGFRDRIRDFEGVGATLLGVSFDKPEANAKFREKFSFPFSLLSDTTRALGLACGACDDAKASSAARVSVVIGPDGKVARVYPKVSAATHPDQVLADLRGDKPAK